MKRKILLFTLALPLIMLQSVVAQTTSRLVGSADWTTDGASFSPVDSMSYAYSGGRGGSKNMAPTNVDVANANPGSPMQFDNAYGWNFVGDSGYYSTYILQTFDANNNVTSSITETYNTVTSSFDLSTNRLYTYNSNNMLASNTLQNWSGSSWTPSTQNVYIYNAAGNIYINQTQTWNTLTSAWDPTSQKTYYYDSSNNELNEIDQTWISGTPVYTTQVTRTYTSLNQLFTTTTSTWNGTNWVWSTMYTHAYDSLGNPLSLLFQNYNSGSSVWVNSTLAIYTHLTTSHLPDTVVHQTWNSAGSGTWVNMNRYSYTYNTYNQVTNITGMSWNVLGIYEFASGDPMSNYYYQTYSPTSVTNVSSKVGEANIYPVPAQNTLHIDLNWNEAQTATISIVDMTGSVVKQWNTPAAAQYSTAVSVNTLASGMYIISINGQQGQIVKQIVVAH